MGRALCVLAPASRGHRSPALHLSRPLSMFPFPTAPPCSDYAAPLHTPQATAWCQRSSAGARWLTAVASWLSGALPSSGVSASLLGPPPCSPDRYNALGSCACHDDRACHRPIWHGVGLRCKPFPPLPLPGPQGQGNKEAAARLREALGYPAINAASRALTMGFAAHTATSVKRFCQLLVEAGFFPTLKAAHHSCGAYGAGAPCSV
jgi:hypothetical protein